MDAFDKNQDSSEEILNDNQLRNRKKKLKKLLEKRGPEEVPIQEDLALKILKLECMIREYEHQQSSSQVNQVMKEKNKESKKKKAKDLKNQKKRQKKQEEELLEREAEKNKEYWANYEKEQERLKKEQRERKQREREQRVREKEQREKEQREKEQREKEQREKEQRWREQQWRGREQRWNRGNNNYSEQSFTKAKLFSDCEIQGIPADLSNLFHNFTKKKYKELTLKYHPDKSEYHDGYIKALNLIKDKHQPVSVKHDETWKN